MPRIRKHSILPTTFLSQLAEAFVPPELGFKIGDSVVHIHGYFEGRVCGSHRDTDCVIVYNSTCKIERWCGVGTFTARYTNWRKV